ncbi:MAG: iron-containing alcohol dehydrogenase [Chloroflexota bacterium]
MTDFGGSSAPGPGTVPWGEFWYLPMEVVRFGPGSLAKLPEEVDRLGGRRAFVITVPSLERSELLPRVRNLLGERLAGVFSGVRAHVPYGAVMECTMAARAASADLLVSFGGGSAIDTARAAALAIGEGVTTVAELEAFRARYDRATGSTIPATSGRSLPHIAVPTTLSAAEFANAGAVTSETRRVKDLLIANELTPRVVLLDPQVAIATPIDLWVSTGMRSIDHAIETVYSPRHQPVTDTLSLESIRRLAAALRAARHDSADLAARAQGQIGAWLSYFGEMNLSLGLSHAIGHQLGPKCGVPHGVTSCILLPHVMRFLAPVTADRQALIAAALGVDTAGLSAEAAAAAAATAVEELVRDLGQPGRLSDVGVSRDRFGEIAEGVLQDLVVAGSPIPIESTAQIMTILEAAA